MNALLFVLFLLAPQDTLIPRPRGMLNDFAGVVDAAHAARIERIATFVRERSGGEIAIVTLADINGRDPGDMALRIGRSWGVGAKAGVGNRARNAGVVILVVPKETSKDGRGYFAISVGQGAEGFISDGETGEFRREAVPALQKRDYGAALELMTARIAEQFAGEFGFSLDSVGVAMPARVEREGRRDGIPVGAIVALIVVMFVVIPALSGRGRGGRGGRGGGLGSALPWILMNSMNSGRRSRGGWGGGWGGGGSGGGGGGGFGGFGGGGGFSGGGSSGSW